MKIAALLLLLSGVLHVVGYVLGNFEMHFLLLPPVIYVVLAVGLRRAMIAAAWIALLCMLVGAAGSLVETTNASGVPPWISWSIFIADLVAACVLCGAIWKTRPHKGTMSP